MSTTTSSMHDKPASDAAEDPSATPRLLDPAALARMRDSATELGELARNEQQRLRTAVSEGRLEAREVLALLARLEIAAIRAERLSRQFHGLEGGAEVVALMAACAE